MLKRIGRSKPVQETIGFLLATYLKLVRRTNRFIVEPADLHERVDQDWPIIIAMWHGQHFMIPFGKRPQDRYHVLISRHGDGEINAIAARHFGIHSIRGSGGRADQVRRKGGAAAMRAMLRALEGGSSMTLTADIPKKARVAGLGIVMLAARSGRPIYPYTIVTSRRFDFSSWDRASLGKPFGRGAMVLGEPIRVAADADEASLEAARRKLEVELDRVQTRAYALIGSEDPGAELSRKARDKQADRTGMSA